MSNKFAKSRQIPANESTISKDANCWPVTSIK